jgi:endonuclease YncB( thermonuclease family)
MTSMVRRYFMVLLLLGAPMLAAAQDSDQSMEAPSAAEAPEGQGVLEGEAAALNGGTIVLKGKPVRLFGVEVPPMESAEGRAARINLDQIIDDQAVSCQILGVDRNQMRVARCAVGDRDLSLAQLMAGVVTVNRVHTRSEGGNQAVAKAFDDAEAEAREAGVGLWRKEPGLADVVAELKAIEQQEPKVVVRPAAGRPAAAETSAVADPLGLSGLGVGILALIAVVIGVVVGFLLAFFGTWWLHRRRAAQERLGLATALYEEVLGIGQRMLALAQTEDATANLRAMLKTNTMARTRTLAGFSIPTPVIYSSTGDRLGTLPAEAVAPVVAFYTAVAGLAATIEAAVSASPTEQLAAPQVREFAQRWLEAEERCGDALMALGPVVSVKGGRTANQDEVGTAEALRKARQEMAAGDGEAAKPATASTLRARPEAAEPTAQRTEPTV